MYNALSHSFSCRHPAYQATATTNTSQCSYRSLCPLHIPLSCVCVCVCVCACVYLHNLVGATGMLKALIISMENA